MSWLVTSSEGVSLPLRTRTDAMILACDLHARFVSASHTSGETISKAEVEAWRRDNVRMLNGRNSPRATVAKIIGGVSVVPTE